MGNEGPSIRLGGVQWGPDRYPTLWVRENGASYAIQLQRTAAYAHGLIDHIRFAVDGREIHHKDGDKWNNHPSNLEALAPERHGVVTREDNRV